MSETQSNPCRSEKVRSKYHPPAGTFTHRAGDVVKILMKDAGNDAVLALRRLVFYMNRAGKRLSNREELEKAKTRLEELEKSRESLTDNFQH